MERRSRKPLGGQRGESRKGTFLNGPPDAIEAGSLLTDAAETDFDAASKDQEKSCGKHYIRQIEGGEERE